MADLAALKNLVLGIRLPWRMKKIAFPLRIPTGCETSADFTSRALALFADPGTRVYVDTSFLMWLTKIGKASRTEFFSWLEKVCPGRVCVPVWSAHEYLRHHVSGTITDELTTRINEIADIAGKSYSYLRPFLDSPLSAGTTSDSQQASARNALNELQKLAQMAKQWHAQYADHANDVIAFINDRVPDRTDIFSSLNGIEALGSDRFDSRVPPGFQDRNKKSKINADGPSLDEGGQQIGSNRWGDLIFWKEVLNLAADERARNVILLTNDQKNDWQLGGRDTPNEPELRDLKSKWRPLPLAHPMLCLEANVEARVQHVMLLDSVYLGLMLKRSCGDEVKVFVDVALVPDPPSIPTEQQQRKEKVRAYKEQEALKETGGVEKSGQRFEDNPQLNDNAFSLNRAWINSKKTLAADSPVRAFLADIQAAILNRQSVADLITKENIGTFDNEKLVALGRNLHDECITGALGNPEAIIDILTIINTIPPKTASCLYLGILGSMYFDKEKKDTRKPPISPAFELVFDAQSEPFAVVPTKIIRDALLKAEELPLYLPNVDKPLIEIKLDHVPDADGEFILGSIMVSDIEVFSEAQILDGLNLRKAFGGRESLSADEILEATCKCFAIPYRQVNYSGDRSTAYQISPTAGFRSPKQIQVQNTEVQK